MKFYVQKRTRGSGLGRSANFQARRSHVSGGSADLEIGDPAGLETCATATQPRHLAQQAFTLMEVMIAIGVFCIGVFAILDVVATVLHGARLLDKPMVDAGVIASEIQTNSVVDGTTGDGYLSDFLGKPYNGYFYAYTINEVQSNRLYQADIDVTSDAPGKPVISKMSILMYAPQSPPGRLDGGYMNSH
jgi:prepilin-type N-terminal cleavage/methylation domain-containing protein